MTITITKENAGERLDKFLTALLKDQSRSQIQRQIKDGDFLVNGKKVTAHCFLKDNDVLSNAEENTKEKKEKKKITDKRDHDIDLKLKIIDEQKDYLVINKPAGLIVHGAGHIKEKTLADILLEKYPEIKNAGDDPIRPGITHRLDKEVSGLMVIARNQKSFLDLKDQFKKRTVEKKYIALVHGKIAKGEGVITFPIVRGAKGKMAALPLPAIVEKEGDSSARKIRGAITEFKVIKRFINYTLLELKILTGRTHQIRVHMSAYGTPIVGDNLYYTQKTKARNKKINLGRIFLAAVELGFDDLNGERKKFKIGLPNELKEFLKQAK
jgi:23S rRNA pseudouridine1911/1915/1917 synthase